MNELESKPNRILECETVTLVGYGDDPESAAEDLDQTMRKNYGTTIKKLKRQEKIFALNTEKDFSFGWKNVILFKP